MKKLITILTLICFTGSCLPAGQGMPQSLSMTDALRSASTAKSSSSGKSLRAELESVSAKNPGLLLAESDLLRIFESCKWKLHEFIKQLSIKGVRKIKGEGDREFLERIGAIGIFKEKFVAVNNLYAGDLSNIRKFFGISPTAAADFKNSFIPRPDRSKILQLCETDLDWDIAQINERLKAFISVVGGVVERLQALGCLDIFQEKLKAVFYENDQDISKTAEFFKVDPETVHRWINDKRLCLYEKKPRMDNVIRLLERYKWDIESDELLKQLRRYGRGSSVLFVLEHMGYSGLLYDRLGRLYKQLHYRIGKIGIEFGYSQDIKAYELSKRFHYRFLRYARMAIFKQNKQRGKPLETDSGIEKVFVRHKWNIRKAAAELAGAFGIAQDTPYIELLDMIYATHILQDRFIAVYCDKYADINNIAEFFGISPEEAAGLERLFMPVDDRFRKVVESEKWHIDRALKKLGIDQNHTGVSLVGYFARAGLYHNFRQKVKEAYMGSGFANETFKQTLGLAKNQSFNIVDSLGLWNEIIGDIKARTGTDMSQAQLAEFCQRHNWDISIIISKMGIIYDKKSHHITYILKKLGVFEMIYEEIKRIYAEKGYSVKQTAAHFNLPADTLSLLIAEDVKSQLMQEHEQRISSLGQVEILRILEKECKWRIPDFIQRLKAKGITVNKSTGGLRKFMKKAGIEAGFNKKFIEKNIEFKGSIAKLSGFFRISTSQTLRLKGNVIPRPSQHDVEELCKSLGWNLADIEPALAIYIRSRGDIIDKFEALGCLGLILNKLKEVYELCGKDISETASFFGVMAQEAQRLLRDKRVGILDPSKDTESEILRILIKYDFKLDKAAKELAAYASARFSGLSKQNTFYIIDNINCWRILHCKLSGIYNEYAYNLRKVALFFGLLERSNGLKRRKLFLQKIRGHIIKANTGADLAPDDGRMHSVFAKNRWRLKDACKEFSGMFGINEYKTRLELLESVYAAHIFQQEFIKVYCSMHADLEKVAGHFQISLRETQELCGGLMPVDKKAKVILAKSGIKAALKKLGYENSRAKHSIEEIFAGAGLYNELSEKFLDEYVAHRFSIEETAGSFGISVGLACRLLDHFSITTHKIQQRLAGKGIDVSPRGFLDFCESKKWDMPAIMSLMGIKDKRYVRSAPAFFEKLGLTDVLKRKLRSVCIDNLGVISSIAAHFHVKGDDIDYWIRQLGINTKDDIIRRRSDIAKTLDREKVKRMFEQCDWSFSAFVSQLKDAGFAEGGFEEALEMLLEIEPVRDVMKERFSSVMAECKGAADKICHNAGIPSSSFRKAFRMLAPLPSKEDITEYFDKECGWSFRNMLMVVNRYVDGGDNKGFVDKLEEMGRADVLSGKLKEVYFECGCNIRKTAAYFKVHPQTISQWLKDKRIYPQDDINQRRKETRTILEGNRWDLKKAFSVLLNHAPGNSIFEALKNLDCEEILYDKMAFVYQETGYDLNRFGRHFGFAEREARDKAKLCLSHMRRYIASQSEAAAMPLDDDGIRRIFESRRWSISQACLEMVRASSSGGQQVATESHMPYTLKGVDLRSLISKGDYIGFLARIGAVHILRKEFITVFCRNHGNYHDTAEYFDTTAKKIQEWKDMLTPTDERIKRFLDNSDWGSIKASFKRQSFNNPNAHIEDTFAGLGLYNEFRDKVIDVLSNAGLYIPKFVEVTGIDRGCAEEMLQRLNVWPQAVKNIAHRQKLNMTQDGLSRLCSETSWKIPDILKRMGVFWGHKTDILRVFKEFGILDLLKQELLKRHLENGCVAYRTAAVFGISEVTLGNLISDLGLSEELTEKLRNQQGMLDKDRLMDIILSSGGSIIRLRSLLVPYGFREGNCFVFLKSIGKERVLKDIIRRVITKRITDPIQARRVLDIKPDFFIKLVEELGMGKEMGAHLASYMSEARELTPQQKALRFLIEEGEIHRITELCPRPESAFRLISIIHGSRLKSSELAYALRRMYRDAGKGGVANDPGPRPGSLRTLSFKTMRQIEWPQAFSPSDLEVLSAEVIRLSYPNLVIDTRGFMNMLCSQSRNQENPEMLRLAYQKAHEYYKSILDDLFFDTIKGIDKENIRMRLYQVAGIHFILDKKRAILADEPGMGKTIQALAAALNAYSGKGANRVLIACPNAAKRVWYDEIKTKTTGKNPTLVVSGSRSKMEHEIAEAKKSRFVIVHYEALRRPEFVAGLKEAGFDFIIVDEAHNMRNTNIHTKALNEFDAEYKLLVSATPLIGRSSAKLFNLLHWLYPERYPSRTGFIKLFSGNFDNMRRLNNELVAFMLRRYKSDVLSELPPKHNVTIEVELLPQQREVYDRIWLDFRSWLGKFARLKTNNGSATVLTKIMKARQAATDARVVEDIECDSIKYQKVDELVRKHIEAGEKIVIFSSFVDVVDSLRKRYADYGAVCVKGNHASANIDAIKQFQSDDFSHPILVSTIDSGFQSINLNKGSVVILVDECWVPEIMDQAAERVHRFGQKKPVTVYRIVAKDTVDEHIRNVQQEARWCSFVSIDGFAHPAPGNIFINRLLEKDPAYKKVHAKIETIIGGIVQQGEGAVKIACGIHDAASGFKLSLKENSEWEGILKDTKGGSVIFASFAQLYEKRLELSAESKAFIRKFVCERLKDEAKSSTPLRSSVLWEVFASTMPLLRDMDLHPRLLQFDTARDIIGSAMDNPNADAETLENIVNHHQTKAQFLKAMYLLDMHNIFKALSELGIFPDDYYYMADALDYQHPIVAIAGNGPLYKDTNILKMIHPAAFKGNGNMPLPSEGLDDKVFIMQCRAMSFPADRITEIRLCREMKKGNTAAPDIIFGSSLDTVSHIAFSVGRNLERTPRVTHSITLRDLFQEAGLVFLKELPAYIDNGFKDQPLRDFIFDKARKEVREYFWQRVSLASRETVSLFDGVYGEDEGGDVMTWLDTIPVKQKTPAEEAETADLLALAHDAIQRLDGLGRKIILLKAQGHSIREISEEIGISPKAVQDEFAEARSKLRRDIAEKEEAFAERVREAARMLKGEDAGGSRNGFQARKPVIFKDLSDLKMPKQEPPHYTRAEVKERKQRLRIMLDADMLTASAA